MILDGRTAVITGGGSGIGAESARVLARAGASVVVAARSQDRIDAIVAEIGRTGGRALAARCDVTDPESISAMVASARAAFGPVHILVNSAGVAPSGPLHRTTLEAWNRVMAVNVTGVFLCTQALMPDMLEAGWGRVVNIASIAGLTGARYISAYAASKHAVIGFTRSLADEVAAKGVTVNAVCPGYVDTPMTDQSLAHIVEKTGHDAGQAMSALLGTTPQGRLISVEECAAAVHFLCSKGARGITGQNIVIDGGSLRA